MAVKTILIKGSAVRKEGIAGGTITPGHLVHRNSSNQFVVHPTAAATAMRAFAMENEVVGGDINDTYAANDTILVAYPAPGSEVYALVPASAAAIVIGDTLESAGNGMLRKATTDAATDDTQRNSSIGKALEAVDNSGGGSPARIKIEVF
jgi:hypothetical protein